jgi:GT2 family glycosyltransferase
MSVEGKRFFYKILSAGGNIYCRVSKIYFGDRAMFIDKDAFNRLSGFKSMAVMSDFDLSLRMKKAGRVTLLKGPIISSGRKFAREAFYRILHLIIWSIFAFYRGVDKEFIREKYYKCERHNNI